MKFELFISDYDKTLGDAPDKISPENVKAIQEYTAKGGKFVICTGRMFSSIERMVCRKAASLWPEGSSSPQSSLWEQGRLGQCTLHPMVMTTSTGGSSDRSLLYWVASISMPCICYIRRTASGLMRGLVSVPAE